MKDKNKQKIVVCLVIDFDAEGTEFESYSIKKTIKLDLKKLEKMLDGLKPTTKEATKLKAMLWSMFP